MALESRGTKFFGFISLKGFPVWDEMEKVDYTTKLYNCFNLLNFSVFAMCGHWQDLGSDGHVETPHVHFYFTVEKQIRVATLINKLSKTLNVSTQAITLDVAQSYEGCIQYLIHLTDLEKTKHEANEIISNLPDEEIKLALARPAQQFNVDFVITTWRNTNNLPRFIKEIGIERYRLYRNVIRDIIDNLPDTSKKEKKA